MGVIISAKQGKPEMPPGRKIDPYSLATLYVEPYFNDQVLGSASAFIVEWLDQYYLFSNYHVFSGRSSVDKSPCHPSAAIPNILRVWYPSFQEKLEWIRCDETLINDNDEPLWIGHLLGYTIDIAALPIPKREGFTYYDIDFTFPPGTDFQIFPTDPASIIGYPLGFGGKKNLPIWKTGHIATDIDRDYDEKPFFIIDATTKEGMSGSPVVARRNGIIRLPDGNVSFADNETMFLGIYSGRLDQEEKNPDLGRVWKQRVVAELLDNAVRIASKRQGDGYQLGEPAT